MLAEAAHYLPGGVNSNFRLGIAPTPLVFERAEGPYLYDVHGNRLIDYYLFGMGPMILGDSPAAVIAAATEQLQRGILFAGQSEAEFAAARLACRARRPAPKWCASALSGAASWRRRPAAGARRHRAHDDRQVRGPLPRPGSTTCSGAPRRHSSRPGRPARPWPCQAAPARICRLAPTLMCCPGTTWICWRRGSSGATRRQ